MGRTSVAVAMGLASLAAGSSWAPADQTLAETDDLSDALELAWVFHGATEEQAEPYIKAWKRAISLSRG
jgi:hypothetical protein